MQTVWGPSPPGRLFTGSPPWRLELKGERYLLQRDGASYQGHVQELEALKLKRGLLWSTCHLPAGLRSLPLSGLPNTAAQRLQSHIRSTIAALRKEERRKALIAQFDAAAKLAIDWILEANRACSNQLRSKGWLGNEFTTTLEQGKPRGLEQLLANEDVTAHLAQQPENVRDAVAFWKRSTADVVNGINQRHLAKQLLEEKPFFDTVEKSPLTEEQAKAVVCFDNRVLLVASAGSGKTSTMVAKAGYAVKRGYFAPHEVLMLAFNKDAAKELRERVTARLKPLGLLADKIEAKTFHSFGLEVIGNATGKRPSLAPWVENNNELGKLQEIVDDLKDKDLGFRTNWDLFRIVFAQDLPKFGKEEESPESWDSEAKRGGFWTLNNEVVKSRGELVIANWLFYNGVRYEYERPYEVDTASSAYKQYTPDFYLPDAKAYLEHWALDSSGEPPADFVGYKQGMVWKRELHATNGTKLLETTMAGLWNGRALQELAAQLEGLGVVLDPNPDREAPGRKPIEDARLARTFRTFLAHVKNNRLSMGELRRRLDDGAAGIFRFRHIMFLNLFERIWSAWKEELREAHQIDFEDMLIHATQHLENGDWLSPYRLVMVDEFQDSSQARARLVAALVKEPGRYLFAVGDDWQSINRFAGADLSIITNFQSSFGANTTLKLETTFRCPPSLCEVSSQFVQKNPSQLKKAVRSPKSNVAEPVRVVRVKRDSQQQMAVESRLMELAAGHVPGAPKTLVYVLGRYKEDQKHIPRAYDSSRLIVEFHTVHASKGLEADHVIIPRMTSETLGFPSRIADDPVLRLAMPAGDIFDFAEERRLFYVALTRSRGGVTLITLEGKESSFIAELVKDQKLDVRNLEGTTENVEACPACGKGVMTPRRGPYGPFLGCSTHPRCRHTKKIVVAPR